MDIQSAEQVSYLLNAVLRFKRRVGQLDDADRAGSNWIPGINSEIDPGVTHDRAKAIRQIVREDCEEKRAAYLAELQKLGVQNTE